MVVEGTLTSHRPNNICKHASHVYPHLIAFSPAGIDDMVKQEKLESHLSHRVVKRIPQTLIALGKSFYPKHLCQYFGNFPKLVDILTNISVDKLSLNSL